MAFLVSSQVVRNFLKESGHAVDATIASPIFTGQLNLHSIGISGGGFVTIYERKKKTGKGI